MKCFVQRSPAYKTFVDEVFQVILSSQTILELRLSFWIPLIRVISWPCRFVGWLFCQQDYTKLQTHFHKTWMEDGSRHRIGPIYYWFFFVVVFVFFLEQDISKIKIRFLSLSYHCKIGHISMFRSWGVGIMCGCWLKKTLLPTNI